jgi:hypothetical protein
MLFRRRGEMAEVVGDGGGQVLAAKLLKLFVV